MAIEAIAPMIPTTWASRPRPRFDVPVLPFGVLIPASRSLPLPGPVGRRAQRSRRIRTASPIRSTEAIVIGSGQIIAWP